MRAMMMVVTAILVVCLVVAMATPNHYTLDAMVVEVNDAVVTAEDNTGNLWDYEVDADAVPVVGTQVTLLMQDMNTEFIYDDQIVGVK